MGPEGLAKVTVTLVKPGPEFLRRARWVQTNLPRPGGSEILSAETGVSVGAIGQYLVAALSGEISASTATGAIPAKRTLWDEAIDPSSWPLDPSTNLRSVFLAAPPFLGLASTTADAPRRPAWLHPLITRLEQVLSLQADWDTYGAMAVRPHEASRVLDFLRRVLGRDTPAPSLVPTGDGGIQLEWHRAGLDIEVLFSGSDDEGLYVRDLQTGEEWEGPPVEGFRRFALAERLEEAAIPVAG
jgi:hypothetical protein